MPRDWFWQLQAAGHGPDWFFFATVAPATVDRLLAAIQQHPLPGFGYYQVVDGPCSRHHHRSTYALYIDQRNYDRVVLSFEGRRSQNTWIYHTIAVCGSDLTLERGYGGYPGMHGATETSLIAAVAAAPDVTLAAWSVGYGGDSYEPGQVASGTTATELLAYLEKP